MSVLDRKVEAYRSLPPPGVRRALREANGLSQDDIAAELDVSRVAVSRWESGDRMPRGDHLIQYAELLERLGRVS